MNIIMRPFNYIFYRNYKYWSKKKDSIPFFSSAGIVSFDMGWLTSGIWVNLGQLLSTYDISLINFYGDRYVHLSTLLVILIFGPSIFVYYHKKKVEIMSAFADSKLNNIPFGLFQLLHGTIVFFLGLIGIICMYKIVHTDM